MGNLGTRVSKPEIKDHHFFFKQVTIKNDGHLISVSRPMMLKQEFDDWISLYNQAKKMQKDFLLLPQSYQIETIKKFWACCQCPADLQLSVSFENFEHLYTEQLQERKKTEEFYSQEDLFIILYNFSIAVKEFQLKGQKFGDIRPSQIVVTSKEKLKMVNRASFPWESTGLQKILEKMDISTKFYLAPQEISAINKEVSFSTISGAKAQAFSLGMTMLEAALLESSEDLYGLNPRTLDTKRLEKQMETIAEAYPNFSYFLGLLLKAKPEERYSAGELFSILKIYSEKILQRHRFVRNEGKQAASLELFRKRLRS